VPDSIDISVLRSFAVIPAAGRSVRMGQHKLLMPWRGASLMEHVLHAWSGSRVSRVAVVVHPHDAALRDVCLRAGADVVVPESPPPEMRDSVQCGLQYIQDHWSPAAEDVWMLAPADMPNLSARLIDTVLEAHHPEAPTILAPCQGERRGHPVLFPWPLAAQVAALDAHQGVNVLLENHPLRCVAGSDPGFYQDVDTPADVERLRER
jgi:molybdenum cofactor cytidylyltransferase